MKLFKKIFIVLNIVFLASIFLVPYAYSADEAVKKTIYFFGREDCKYCQLEKSFFEDLKKERNDFNLIYFNVADKANRDKFNELAELKNISKVTPLTFIGGMLIQGFDSKETTGQRMMEILDDPSIKEIGIDEYIASGGKGSVLESGGSCGSDEDGIFCTVESQEEKFVFKLPFFGPVDLRSLSLFSLAAILGFVDGFNPCAMGVLIAFLLILLQVGDRKKMWQVAGLFILAESVMYYLILNVWYKTWDFIGLDYIVTPLVALLAVGAGVYFLYKYFKDGSKLTCSVESIESQQKRDSRIKRLVNSPFTIITIFGILAIAFSVNIIEFACSIGIPQAFTKILEINNFGFFKVQGYTLVYIFTYMIDDIIVFALALYGFGKIHASYKYSRLSGLIGGVLMLILGFLLLFFPQALIF
ncbi:MAG: glutaredoxin [Parcubacteria group bacterium]|nr:glutaredoxin [Parcubacteria group bacterium]MCR4343117.1 glutaredoxin [Patescibacteria group bacterium]